MRPRPAMAGLATVTAAVITLGAFARGGASHSEPGGPASEAARPGGPAADRAADATTERTGATGTDRADTTTTAPADAPRRLEVEAGMSTEVNPLGTRHSSAGAVLTNPYAEAAYGVDVTFELKDASGAVIDTARENVPYLPPHGRRIVAPLQVGFDVPVEPTSIEVGAEVREFAEDVGPEGGDDVMRRPDGARLQVVRAALVDDEYLSKVTGEVSNLTPEVARFSSLHCVLRSEGGIVGGAASGISAPIVPGGTVTFESMLPAAPDDVDTVDCEVHASPLH